MFRGGKWAGRSVLALALLITAQSRADGETAGGTAAPGLAVGKVMEDFGLRQLDFTTGKLAQLVWLSDIVGEKPDRKTPGKLLLLNFFATWCKPCMHELPVLVRLQNEYRAQGLKVLSINYRTEAEAVDDAIAASRKQWAGAAPPFPVLFDRYTNRNQLIYMGARAGLPCNILIDEKGVVLARFQGGDATQLEALEAGIRKQLSLAPGAK
jgi:thiol-disulfide isomerase/thioredoxin